VPCFCSVGLKIQSKVIKAIGECTTNVLMSMMLFFVLCSLPTCAVLRHCRKWTVQLGLGVCYCCLCSLWFILARPVLHGEEGREVATFG